MAPFDEIARILATIERMRRWTESPAVFAQLQRQADATRRIVEKPQWVHEIERISKDIDRWGAVAAQLNIAVPNVLTAAATLQPYATLWESRSAHVYAAAERLSRIALRRLAAAPAADPGVAAAIRDTEEKIDRLHAKRTAAAASPLQIAEFVVQLLGLLISLVLILQTQTDNREKRREHAELVAAVHRVVAAVRDAATYQSDSSSTL